MIAPGACGPRDAHTRSRFDGCHDARTRWIRPPKSNPDKLRDEGTSILMLSARAGEEARVEGIQAEQTITW